MEGWKSLAKYKCQQRKSLARSECQQRKEPFAKYDSEDGVTLRPMPCTLPSTDSASVFVEGVTLRPMQMPLCKLHFTLKVLHFALYTLCFALCTLSFTFCTGELKSSLSPYHPHVIFCSPIHSCAPLHRQCKRIFVQGVILRPTPLYHFANAL